MPTGIDDEDGSNGIAIAAAGVRRCAGLASAQKHVDNTPSLTEFAETITKKTQARFVDAGEGNIEPPITIKVQNGKGASILSTINPTDQRSVNEAVTTPHHEPVALISTIRVAQIDPATVWRLMRLAEMSIEKGPFPIL
ncbi:MAG: hypothetical protein P8P32_16795 [Akkermansiaceae bacterium]|nr:hypothetical protein [Akkermansiaceae bacterium]MDG2323252.1 hypothetical protein [Akkermansiaceae bacterium]